MGNTRQGLLKLGTWFAIGGTVQDTYRMLGGSTLTEKVLHGWEGYDFLLIFLPNLLSPASFVLMKSHSFASERLASHCCSRDFSTVMNFIPYGIAS